MSFVLPRPALATIAALGVALCTSLPAHAAYFEAYASVDGGSALGAPDQIAFNATGAMLPAAVSGASATTTLFNQTLSVADSTHWTLGPYAATRSDVRFSVAGGGEAATVSFTFEVLGAMDLSLDASHNAGASFGLELYGQGADAAGGGISDVNCLGCGGHISMGSLYSHGVSTPWDGTSVNAVYTLTTTVDTGRQDAGRLIASASMGAGSTHGNMAIRLTSTLLNGQVATLVDNGAAGWSVSAVPEPSTWGLALAGLCVAGLARRRRA
ncbi:MAG: hypothetical protein RI907_211 [Pseudomonadota bacterium]|jgi:hypothetical protein